MGHILYWALLRFAIILFASWAIRDWVDDPSQWWTMFFLSVTVLVVYPAQMAYQKHQREVQRTDNSLCATCKHYIRDNTLCSVLDEHVTIAHTPCEGVSWEPASVSEYAE
jgi:hypothetical protein